jgi:hypothetical protein
VLDLEGGRSADMPLAPEDQRLLEAELPDHVQAFAWAPAQRPLLIFQTQYHAWLADLRGRPLARYVGNVAGFSPAGDHLVWARYEAEARLAVEDLDDAAAVRELAPRGATALMYFTEDPQRVLFLASYGGSGLDLFDGDLQSGVTRRLASGVPLLESAGRRDRVAGALPLAAADARVLVIANWSAQDRSGDLLLVDRASGAQTVLAGGVRDFAVAPACAGCGVLDAGAALAIVRVGREAAASDGLWAAALP